MQLSLTQKGTILLNLMIDNLQTLIIDLKWLIDETGIINLLDI